MIDLAFYLRRALSIQPPDLKSTELKRVSNELIEDTARLSRRVDRLSRCDDPFGEFVKSVRASNNKKGHYR